MSAATPAADRPYVEVRLYPIVHPDSPMRSKEWRECALCTRSFHPWRGGVGLFCTRQCAQQARALVLREERLARAALPLDYSEFTRAYQLLEAHLERDNAQREGAAS